MLEEGYQGLGGGAEEIYWNSARVQHSGYMERQRRKGKEGTMLLDDKTHIAQQKERYNAYSVVVEEAPVEDGVQFYAGDYDDEYDDTYDGNQVGANDVDSDDELISR
eukprot:g46337.t1